MSQKDSSPALSAHCCVYIRSFVKPSSTNHWRWHVLFTNTLWRNSQKPFLNRGLKFIKWKACILFEAVKRVSYVHLIFLVIVNCSLTIKHLLLKCRTLAHLHWNTAILWSLKKIIYILSKKGRGGSVRKDFVCWEEREFEVCFW